MKRFRFRLESVLRLRRFELDRARAQLAALEEERVRRQTALEGERRRVAEGKALLERDAWAGCDGEHLAMRADAVMTGRLREAHAARALDELRGPIDEARRRVEHAHARVRSLERLEEEAAAEHRRAGFAAEQAELEELALGRVARERMVARRARDLETRARRAEAGR